MTKIKVGQIWADKDGDEEGVNMIVITKKHDENEYSYIYRCGETVAYDDPCFIRTGRKVIAKYKTWQKAVNSKEFKGE